MKVKDGLAAQYWIDNTNQIYEDNLHISSPVMDAYRAGFQEAKERAISIIFNQQGVSLWTDEDTIELIRNMGEEDERQRK